MQALVVGRLAGVEIRLHPTVLVVVVLIVLDLATGPFRTWHPGWSPAVGWSLAALASVLFLGSILLHELAHSLVARALGLPVRDITLFLFGGVSNLAREPESARTELLVSIVGPLTSLALGVGFLVLGGAAAGPTSVAEPGQLGPWATLFGWLGAINLIVAVFNLIPAFPLDGGRVLRSILWAGTGDLLRATRWAATVGRTLGFALVGVGLLMVFGVFEAGPITGLWLAFVGWFVAQAAAGVHAQAVIGRALHEVRVADVMGSRVAPIAADATVPVLVDRLMHQEQRAFPVVDGERLVGVVTLADLRKVPRALWAETRVAALMTPREQLRAVLPTDPAADVVEALGRQGVDQVPVVEAERVRGFVRREDIARWVELHSE